jgi:hypothetical protein
MVWHRTFARLAERADVHPGLKKVGTILAIFELFGNRLEVFCCCIISLSFFSILLRIFPFHL